MDTIHVSELSNVKRPASRYPRLHLWRRYVHAGLKLVYLPPYSPDLNPIEEFFAKLKAFY